MRQRDMLQKQLTIGRGLCMTKHNFEKCPSPRISFIEKVTSPPPRNTWTNTRSRPYKEFRKQLVRILPSLKSGQSLKIYDVPVSRVSGLIYELSDLKFAVRNMGNFVQVWRV